MGGTRGARPVAGVPGGAARPVDQDEAVGAVGLALQPELVVDLEVRAARLPGPEREAVDEHLAVGQPVMALDPDLVPGVDVNVALVPRQHRVRQAQVFPAPDGVWARP